MNYREKMQMLYENEVNEFFEILPDLMVTNHISITHSKKKLNKIKAYWKKRVDHSWRQFLFSEIDKFISENK